MNQKRFIIFLFLVILLFTVGLFYVLDSVGIIKSAEIFPFLAPKNPLKIEDKDYPTEVEKVEFQKWEQKLLEREENLVRKENELKGKESSSEEIKRELEDARAALKAERQKLQAAMNTWDDRQKKIRDLAEKVRNMPPQKAQEMMQNWRDFDVIEVMRQMDKDAETEGTSSIVPYLLTLFQPDRRAEITRKMMLPSLTQTDDVVNEEK